VMENPEYAAALLQRVREIGAALMLDRFGAGYTSLGHLPEYRFDAMRIDGSLVRPNSFGARSPILRSIVTMAQEIGMDVISEGAETESDAVELAQLGCQFAQGAAFGQPMSAAAARKLMGAAAA
jgi:EAL domain-containing protein (putative c-di-GMP-specific phosphodiesterase class I)